MADKTNDKAKPSSRSDTPAATPQGPDGLSLAPPKYGIDAADKWFNLVTSAAQAASPGPMLRIGSPDDVYEREADRISEQVMRSAEPFSNASSISTSAAPSIQRMCAACQTEDEPVQAKRSEEATEANPASINDIAKLRHSAGRPLPNEVRHFMETRFLHDFSRVRVHDGGAAAAVAQSLHSRAFTLGSDVVFGRGEYQPDTSSGRGLIAHELTHVVQQSGTAARPGELAVQRSPIGVLQRKQPDPESRLREVVAGSAGKASQAAAAAVLEVKGFTSDPANTVAADPDVAKAVEASYEKLQAVLRTAGYSKLPPGTMRLVATATLNSDALAKVQAIANERNWTVVVYRAASASSIVTETTVTPSSPGSATAPAPKAAKQPSPHTGLFEHSTLVETLMSQIDGMMFKEAFQLLDSLDDAELSKTVKELKRVSNGGTMVLAQHFQDAFSASVNWERIMVALDSVDFTEKQRHVDSYLKCDVHPSSFGAGGSLTLNVTYALTPDRALLLKASEIGDEEPTGDELAAQSETHLGDAGLLFPKKLNKGTVPKLWAAKQRIIKEIEIQNFTFVMTAYSGAEAGLGAGQMGLGVIGRLMPVGARTPAPTSGQALRWTGANLSKGSGGSQAGAAGKTAPPITASRSEVLNTAYNGFKGRAGGLTGNEQGALAKIREFFKLPPKPTDSNKSIVGLLKIYDPDVEPIPLVSQKEGGPAGGSSTGSVPRGPGTGFDRYSTIHVEGHAAGKMNDLKAKRGVLLIELDFCVQCDKNLPQMLPKGSELIVVSPTSTTIVRSSQL